MPGISPRKFINWTSPTLLSLLLILVAYHLKLPSGLIQALRIPWSTDYVSAQRMYTFLFMWFSMTSQTIRAIDSKDGTGSDGATMEQPQPPVTLF